MSSSETKPVLDEAEIERIVAAMNTTINIVELQAEVYEWSFKNFGAQSAHRPLLGIGEEVGELMHAHLKLEQGIRTNEHHRAKQIDALGDIFVYMCDYASRAGISLQHAIALAWSEVKLRDWRKEREKSPDVQLDLAL